MGLDGRDGLNIGDIPQYWVITSTEKRKCRREDSKEPEESNWKVTDQSIQRMSFS